MNKKYIALGLLALAAGLGYYFFIYKKKNTTTNAPTDLASAGIHPLDTADQAVYSDILSKFKATVPDASGVLSWVIPLVISNASRTDLDPYYTINGAKPVSGLLLATLDSGYSAPGEVGNAGWGNSQANADAHHEFEKYKGDKLAASL